jgi:hypothetical protein
VVPPRPERPPEADYYERDRVELFTQGDLFRDVPLAYPMPAAELLVDEEGGGGRRFLSGPLEFGPAMLITPSCSLAAQRGAGYRHPVRTLVPVVALDELVQRGVIKEAALHDVRRFDHLINYMYLPPLEVEELEFAMPEGVALLYMPVTLHHAFLEGQRVSQLAYRARSSCSASSSGSTPDGSRTISTPSTRRWTEAIPISSGYFFTGRSPVASRYQAMTFLATARSRLVHFRPIRSGHRVLRKSFRNV